MKILKSLVSGYDEEQLVAFYEPVYHWMPGGVPPLFPPIVGTIMLEFKPRQ